MSRGHVLVIEDHPDNQQLITWLLEDEDFDVTCADTGEAGLELLQENTYDALLTDISLPGIDGKEVTRQLRSDPKYSALPIVALTAHTNAKEHQEIMSSGADDILTKPVDESALAALLDQIKPH